MIEHIITMSYESISSTASLIYHRRTRASYGSSVSHEDIAGIYHRTTLVSHSHDDLCIDSNICTALRTPQNHTRTLELISAHRPSWAIGATNPSNRIILILYHRTHMNIWRHIAWISITLMVCIIVFLLWTFAWRGDRFSVLIDKDQISWYNDVIRKINTLSWSLTKNDISIINQAAQSQYRELASWGRDTLWNLPKLQALAQAKECVQSIWRIDQTRKTIWQRHQLIIWLLQDQLKVLPLIAPKITQKQYRDCLVTYRWSVSRIIRQYVMIMQQRKSFTQTNEQKLSEYPNALWPCPDIIAIEQQTVQRDTWTKSIQTYHTTIQASIASWDYDAFCTATQNLSIALWQTWIAPQLQDLPWLWDAIQQINARISTWQSGRRDNFRWQLKWWYGK